MDGQDLTLHLMKDMNKKERYLLIQALNFRFKHMVL